MILEPLGSDLWFQVAFAELAAWGKKGEKEIACFVNWVDLAWKTLRHANGSLKHIFIIFKFKQSWGGGVVNGVCRKNMSRYERDHDGLWVFLFKKCEMLLLCYLFYDVFLLWDFSLTPSSGCTDPLFFLPLQHTLQTHSLRLAFSIKLTAVAFLSTIMVTLFLLLLTLLQETCVTSTFFNSVFYCCQGHSTK